MPADARADAPSGRSAAPPSDAVGADRHPGKAQHRQVQPRQPAPRGGALHRLRRSRAPRATSWRAPFTHRGRTFRILDTAGIRRKSKVTDPVEYYSVNRAIESIGRADIVFLMIDAAAGHRGPGQEDRRAGGEGGQGRRARPREVGPAEGHGDAPREGRASWCGSSSPCWASRPIVPGVRAHRLRRALPSGHGARRLWSQLHRRVGTGRLNQALESWMAHYKLPSGGRTTRSGS